MKCWNATPGLRPSFEELSRLIDASYGDTDMYNQPIYGDPIDFGYLEAAP